MKITRIRFYKTDLPYIGGSYGRGGGIAMNGRLYAPGTPGLGVTSDPDSLGVSVTIYGGDA